MGIFNFNNEETSVEVPWSEIGISGKKNIRDVWRQKNIGTYKNAFKTMVRPHGCVVVKINDK